MFFWNSLPSSFFDDIADVGNLVSGSPLQYSCLGNPMDRGALGALVHGVAKSRACLSD